MMTLAQLFTSTAQFRAGKPINPTRMTKVQTLAAIPVGNMFVCEARFQPLTELTMPFHQATIVFHNMEFVLQKDPDHPVTVELEPGRIVYMNKPSVSKNQCKVRCTCAWYYFASWFANKKRQVFAGTDMPKYVRKTPPPPYGRAYVNPGMIPNICKHTTAFAVYLQQKKVISA